MDKCKICGKADGRQVKTWPNNEVLCPEPHHSGETTDYATKCELCHEMCNAGWVDQCKGPCKRSLCERHRDIATRYCKDCMKSVCGTADGFHPKHK